MQGAPSGGGYPASPADGASANHPGAPAAYPGASAGYPGATTYPGAPGGYPGAQSGYPGAPAGHPGTPGSPSGYPAPYGAPYGVAPTAPRPLAGLAITALVLGVIAFFIGFVPFLGLLVGLVAVILGIVALVRRQRKAFAITGIVAGAIGLLVSVAATIGWFVIVGSTLVSSAPDSSAAPVAPEVSASATPLEPAPEESGEPDSFRTLDDAAFAAITSDPGASYGEDVILYGEVQQFDDATGACQIMILVDNSQQESWEGYEEYAMAYAASSQDADSTCPEFEGVSELDHLKISATVLGVTTVEFDDDTVDDLLTLGIHSVEQLDRLP